MNLQTEGEQNNLVPQTKTNNSKKLFLPILGVVALTVIVGFLIYVLTQKESEILKRDVVIAELEEKFPDMVNFPEPEEWDRIDEASIIAVDFPADWGLRWGESYYFKQSSGTEDYTWSIQLKANGAVSEKVTIDKLGATFPDRRVVSIEEMVINNIPAKKVEVASDSYPYLREAAILMDGKEVGRPDKYVVISNHGNNFPFFERFYSSFQLKPLQPWEIVRKERNRELEQKEPEVRPSTASAEGSLDVEYVGNDQYILNGTLIPPKPCTGNELIQFNLAYGNGETKSYSVADCQTQEFSETMTVPQSFAPVFPELIMRQVDEGTDVWVNYLQARYKIVTTTNPPNIQSL